MVRCGRLCLLLSGFIAAQAADPVMKLEEPVPGDEDEFVDLLEVDLKSAAAFIDEKRIYDAKTAYAIQYLQLQEVLESTK